MFSNKHKPIQVAILVLLMVGLSCLVKPQPVSGQDATPTRVPDYKMSVARTFGYSAAGQIRGNFRLTVVGPEQNIRQVVFLIDGQAIGKVTQPPFQMDIQTQDYPEGVHTLSAEVSTTDGNITRVQGGTYNFVSSQQQWSGLLTVIGVIFGILILIVAIGFLFTYLTTGKTVKDLPLGTERKYGYQGGGVCSRCERPFAFHWWGINLVGSKFDRCDYCGKWGKVKRIPLEDLRAAESAELEGNLKTPAEAQKNDQERTKELLDQSRFMD
jgi:Bacterial Ig domain